MNIRNDLKNIKEVIINLLLTRRCNYSCFHCMYASGPNMPADEMRGEDLLEVKSFIDSLSEHLPLETNILVNLIGGEPSLNMEHLARTIDIVSSWNRSLPQDSDWVNGIEMEMTTNGWWLEKYEDAVAFAKATWREINVGKLTVRISNSPYHDEFRPETLRYLFKNSQPTSGYGERQASRLEGHLQELAWAPEPNADPEEEEEYQERPGDWLLMELAKGAERDRIYIDWKTPGEEKVSPVGRAKTNQIGYQDGACGPTGSVKFTFMPTKPGERPGRLYDPCCNGGKVPLGFADEGVGLLVKRILFMRALHAAHPIPERGFGHPNPGGGSRCLNCPSFGGQWLRENKDELASKVTAALHSLREPENPPAEKEHRAPERKPKKKAVIREGVAILATLALTLGWPLEGLAQPPLPATVKVQPAGMQDIESCIPFARYEPIYATPNNPTGQPLYPEGSRAWAAGCLVDALQGAARALALQGYGLRVHDAYRPHSVTIALWNAALAAGLPANSYGSPWITSAHNKGAAIDVSLYRLDGKPGPEKPSEIDSFQTASNSPEARAHARILRECLVDAGFEPHRREWWHFSFPEAERLPPGDWPINPKTAKAKQEDLSFARK